MYTQYVLQSVWLQTTLFMLCFVGVFVVTSHVLITIEDFLEMDDYVSTLVMEMEQLSQLDPHPNIVGLLRVCTVGSK